MRVCGVLDGSWKLIQWRSGMGFDVLERGEIPGIDHMLSAAFDGRLLQDHDVLAAFKVEGFPGLLDLLMLMDELGDVLEAEGDEQTEANGGHVNEELLPGHDGVVGWV